MASTLTCLGTGSILQCADRNPAGYLLETELPVRSGAPTPLLLLDAGPGTLRRLAELEVDRARIRHVVLSHYHLDHHVDLLGLLFQRRNPDVRRRAEPLRIHGPPGFRTIYERWQQAYGSWVADETLEIGEIAPGAYEIEAGLTVHAFENRHSAYGYCYRFELGSGSLAYSGDTESCPGLEAACADVEFALVECSFPDALRQEGHLCPADIRDLVRRAAPRRIGLTHFYPEMARLADDPVAWAELWGGLSPVPRALRDLESVSL